SRWREDILGSAGVLSLDSRLAGWIQQYRAAPTPAVQTILRLRLEPWIGGKTLADIAVTDPAGNILFSLSGETGPLPRDEAAALQQALSLHRPVLTDLHREPGVSPHVSAAAPLFA